MSSVKWPGKRVLCLRAARLSSPGLKDLILTHIFEKDLDKRLDKAEVLLISTRRVALPGSFAKLICKMWVRIRSKAQGLSGAAFSKLCPGRVDELLYERVDLDTASSNSFNPHALCDVPR